MQITLRCCKGKFAIASIPHEENSRHYSFNKSSRHLGVNYPLKPDLQSNPSDALHANARNTFLAYVEVVKVGIDEGVGDLQEVGDGKPPCVSVTAVAVEFAELLQAQITGWVRLRDARRVQVAVLCVGIVFGRIAVNQKSGDSENDGNFPVRLVVKLTQTRKDRRANNRTERRLAHYERTCVRSGRSRVGFNLRR